MNLPRLLFLFVCLTTTACLTFAQMNLEREAIAANERGAGLVKSGRYQEAVEAFESSIKLSPTFAVAYNNLGVSYSSLGRLEDAIKVLKRALELTPGYAEAYFNLGVALQRLGQPHEAIDAYRRGFETDWRDHYPGINAVP